MMITYHGTFGHELDLNPKIGRLCDFPESCLPGAEMIPTPRVNIFPTPDRFSCKWHTTIPCRSILHAARAFQFPHGAMTLQRGFFYMVFAILLDFGTFPLTSRFYSWKSLFKKLLQAFPPPANTALLEFWECGHRACRRFCGCV